MADELYQAAVAWLGALQPRKQRRGGGTRGQPGAGAAGMGARGGGGGPGNDMFDATAAEADAVDMKTHEDVPLLVQATKELMRPLTRAYSSRRSVLASGERSNESDAAAAAAADEEGVYAQNAYSSMFGHVRVSAAGTTRARAASTGMALARAVSTPRLLHSRSTRNGTGDNSVVNSEPPPSVRVGRRTPEEMRVELAYACMSIVDAWMQQSVHSTVQSMAASQLKVPKADPFQKASVHLPVTMGRHVLDVHTAFPTHTRSLSQFALRLILRHYGHNAVSVCCREHAHSHTNADLCMCVVALCWHCTGATAGSMAECSVHGT